MTQVKHTPGPWELIQFGGPQIGNKASGEAVCTMWGDEEDPLDPIHANARLIAAAPELLDVGIRLRASLDPESLNLEQFNAWCDLDAAIAKAAGEA